MRLCVGVCVCVCTLARASVWLRVCTCILACELACVRLCGRVRLCACTLGCSHLCAQANLDHTVALITQLLADQRCGPARAHVGAADDEDREQLPSVPEGAIGDADVTEALLDYIALVADMCRPAHTRLPPIPSPQHIRS